MPDLSEVNAAISYRDFIARTLADAVEAGKPVDRHTVAAYTKAKAEYATLTEPG